MNIPIQTAPTIEKAARIAGKSIVFRNAEIKDAEFILSLRTDSQKSRFISFTAPRIDEQIAWLEEYAHKTDQAYFIIEDLLGEALGTIRLYDPQFDCVCWGSWILKHGAPQSASIESALIIYAYAFDNLGFEYARFDVRKKNESVWQFNERLGAMRIAETERDFHYRIAKTAFLNRVSRYRKFLPATLMVERIQ